MMVAIWVLIAAAGIGWLTAAIASIRLLSYRQEGRSIVWYLWRGYAFYDARNFRPEGRATQRVFLFGLLGFVASLLGLAIVAVLSS